MEYTIKKNDAFLVLQKVVSKDSEQLEEIIIDGMIEEQLIFTCDFEVYGKSIHSICNDNGIEVPTIIQILFPGELNNEVPELLKSIFIWGDSCENECDECGCEMESEEDSHGKHSWTNFNCSNPNCSNGWSNEPDWDSMPGGHDYN